MLISPDGNNIKIEQIRDIQKRIQEKPIISEKKVYIIDNADLMTTEAQNCLLKTLEEPPEFAVNYIDWFKFKYFFANYKIKMHNYEF